MKKQTEDELRAAIAAELCNGNWLYLGKGNPVEHVLRAVKSAVPLTLSKPSPRKRKK